MNPAELSAEAVNMIEDWVCRLEAAARQMQDAADQMSGAADRNNEAANRMKSAVDHIPYSIRLER